MRLNTANIKFSAWDSRRDSSGPFLFLSQSQSTKEDEGVDKSAQIDLDGSAHLPPPVPADKALCIFPGLEQQYISPIGIQHHTEVGSLQCTYLRFGQDCWEDWKTRDHRAILLWGHKKVERVQ